MCLGRDRDKHCNNNEQLLVASFFCHHGVDTATEQTRDVDHRLILLSLNKNFQNPCSENVMVHNCVVLYLLARCKSTEMVM